MSAISSMLDRVPQGPALQVPVPPMPVPPMPVPYITRTNSCVLRYALDTLTRQLPANPEAPGTDSSNPTQLQGPGSEPRQLTLGERAEVVRIFNETFPLYWPVPPPSFEERVHDTRMLAHEACYLFSRENTSYLEEVKWFFEVLKPLVAELMPWEELLRTDASQIHEYYDSPPHFDASDMAGWNRSNRQSNRRSDSSPPETHHMEMMPGDLEMDSYYGSMPLGVIPRQNHPPEARESGSPAGWGRGDQIRRYEFTDLAPSKTPVTRRKIDGDCMICWEPLDERTGWPEFRRRTTWCKSFCGVNYHLKCFNQWAEQADESRTTIRCPLCRRIWV